MHCGLSKDDVKKISFSVCKDKFRKNPASWDINCQAGEQWLADFRKRNPELSLRKRRSTSIARAPGFNKPVVKLFFEKYASVLEKHRLSPNRIYNADEMGISSVYTLSLIHI